MKRMVSESQTRVGGRTPHRAVLLAAAAAGLWLVGLAPVAALGAPSRRAQGRARGAMSSAVALAAGMTKVDRASLARREKAFNARREIGNYVRFESWAFFQPESAKGKPIRWDGYPKTDSEKQTSLQQLRTYLGQSVSPSLLAGFASRGERASQAYARLLPKLRLKENAKKVAGADSEIKQARTSSSNTIGADAKAGSSSLVQWEKAEAKVMAWIKKDRPVSVEAIQELNATLEPLEGQGKIRGAGQNVRNNKMNYAKCYVPGEYVARELGDLVSWYETAEKSGMAPVVLAALTYQRLVSVHPFADGNGRTSRLVLDWVLRKHGLPPATFGSDDHNVAIYGTAAAAGQVTPAYAVWLVARGVERTLSTYQDALR